MLVVAPEVGGVVDGLRRLRRVQGVRRLDPPGRRLQGWLGFGSNGLRLAHLSVLGLLKADLVGDHERVMVLVLPPARHLGHGLGKTDKQTMKCWSQLLVG